MESAEVSAEVHFAQKLASNEKNIRDRAIKRLRKYLFAKSNHGGLTEEDMIKIWKGLHYCMWMQDKPLLQEELSGKITSLLQSFPSCDGALLFMKVFLETQAREWNGIDKFRLDKFMMMIRDMLHQVFTLLSKWEWQVAQCRQFSEALALKVMLPTEARLPDGLKLHLADIYVDELKKVSLDKMSSRKLVVLLRPFIDFIIYSPKTELASRVMSEVLCKVINTMSTVKHYPPPSSSSAKSHSTSDKGRKKKGEEVNNNDGEEEMEDEGIEDDEADMNETEDENIFIMDADFLLFLLFKLAKDPKVKAANRALVYNLVKKHPEIYDNIVNTLNSSPVDNIRAKDDGDLEDENGNLEDLALFHADGPKGEEQQQKKRRRKRKKDRMREEEAKNADDLLKQHSQPDSEDSSQQAKKKKKHKQLKEKDSKSPKENISPLNEPLPDSSPHSSARDNSSRPGKRKRHDDTDPANDVQKPKLAKLSLDGQVQQDSEVSPTTPERKSKKKKSKNLSQTDDLSGSGNVSPSADSLRTATPKLDSTTTVSMDKNSNARGAQSESPRMSSTELFSSAVEMVIYPKKNPPSPKRKEGSKKQHMAGVNAGENVRLTSSNKGTGSPLRSLQRAPSRSPSPSSPTLSSSSLAASLLSSAAERKRTSKKSRRKSKESSSSSSLSGYLASAGQDCENGDSTGKEDKDFSRMSVKSADGSDNSVVEDVAAAAKSVFSSLKEKYMDPLISTVTASQSKDNAGSESSMDWSLAPHSESSSSAALPSPEVLEEDGNNSTVCDEKMSRSDPGPNRKKVKCVTKSESSFVTPHGKKKVVFDLRRNQANKFQDYIKSLRKQPESPHVPEKSPSTSILRPGLSPSLDRVGGAKKKLGQGRLKKSPKKKKKSHKDSSSPSPPPSDRKLKTVRSRSDSRLR